MKLINPALVACTLIFTACEPASDAVPESKSLSQQADLIEAYVDAFNRKDLATMRDMMHPDIEWLSVSGSEMQTVMSGKEALSKDLEGMFDSGFEIRSSTSVIQQTGPHLVTVETARYPDDKGGEASQSSIAVYEIGEDNLIRRVWYFPESING